jgi:hypothetical protein
MSDYIPYFEMAALVASIIAWPTLVKSSYLKLFPILLFTVVLIEAWSIFFYQYIPLTKSKVYNIQIPIQHLLYLLILYLSVVRASWKKFIIIGGVFFLAFTTITVIWFTAPNRFNVLSYCVGSLLIIIGILMKLYEMLQKPTDFNFLKDPFFFILFAYLLFNVGTLPYFVMSNWLYFIQTQEKITQILINVMAIFNYILYATYTLAFLWMSRKKGHS